MPPRRTVVVPTARSASPTLARVSNTSRASGGSDGRRDSAPSPPGSASRFVDPGLKEHRAVSPRGRRGEKDEEAATVPWTRILLCGEDGVGKHTIRDAVFSQGRFFVDPAAPPVADPEAGDQPNSAPTSASPVTVGATSNASGLFPSSRGGNLSGALPDAVPEPRRRQERGNGLAPMSGQCRTRVGVFRCTRQEDTPAVPPPVASRRRTQGDTSSVAPTEPPRPRPGKAAPQGLERVRVAETAVGSMSLLPVQLLELDEEQTARLSGNDALFAADVLSGATTAVMLVVDATKHFPQPPAPNPAAANPTQRPADDTRSSAAGDATTVSGGSGGGSGGAGGTAYEAATNPSTQRCHACLEQWRTQLEQQQVFVEEEYGRTLSTVVGLVRAVNGHHPTPQRVAVHVLLHKADVVPASFAARDAAEGTARRWDDDVTRRRNKRLAGGAQATTAVTHATVGQVKVPRAHGLDMAAAAEEAERELAAWIARLAQDVRDAAQRGHLGATVTSSGDLALVTRPSRLSIVESGQPQGPRPDEKPRPTAVPGCTPTVATGGAAAGTPAPLLRLFNRVLTPRTDLEAAVGRLLDGLAAAAHLESAVVLDVHTRMCLWASEEARPWMPLPGNTERAAKNGAPQRRRSLEEKKATTAPETPAPATAADDGVSPEGPAKPPGLVKPKDRPPVAPPPRRVHYADDDDEEDLGPLPQDPAPAPPAAVVEAQPEPTVPRKARPPPHPKRAGSDVAFTTWLALIEAVRAAEALGSSLAALDDLGPSLPPPSASPGAGMAGHRQPGAFEGTTFRTDLGWRTVVELTNDRLLLLRPLTEPHLCLACVVDAAFFARGGCSLVEHNAMSFRQAFAAVLAEATGEPVVKDSAVPAPAVAPGGAAMSHLTAPLAVASPLPAQGQSGRGAALRA